MVLSRVRLCVGGRSLQRTDTHGYALRARFDLLKAGFYESFVLDPFEFVGIGFDDLKRQIAEAVALASALSSSTTPRRQRSSTPLILRGRRGAIAVPT
jgi:hypothetical protein